MAQEFNAGEWIADGVLAALGEDPETSTQGKLVLQRRRIVLASLPALKLRVRNERHLVSPRGPLQLLPHWLWIFLPHPRHLSTANQD